MKLAITKKNAERIFQGMFINRAGLATNELTVPHNLTGIVLFVDDKFVYVDTGKEFCGDTDECLKHVHDGEIPDTAQLKTISRYVRVINDRCHFLNWPTWDNWYWGDALYGASSADGKPTEAVNLCNGAIGWPHQSKDTRGNLLIPKAKVRIIKRIPLK